jgi:FAD synthase
VTLTIGSFDGVHLGHVDVIHRTVAAAAADGAQPALLTFEPHPRCVLDPANCPQSITTLQEKLALVESLGIEHAIVIRFDRALSSLTPQEFVDLLAPVMEVRRWWSGSTSLSAGSAPERRVAEGQRARSRCRRVHAERKGAAQL